MTGDAPFSEELPPLALALAELMRLRARAEPAVAAASAALLARERAAGHSCIALAAHAGSTVLGVRLPETAAWARALAASGLASDGGDATPLMLVDGRLSLRRYWLAEQRLAAAIRARLAMSPDVNDAAVQAPLVAGLFPRTAAVDWQAVAALADGELIAEKPRAKPNPTVEVRESLPDGTEFKAVWSLLRQSGVAKLVTIHFFDRG